MKTLYWTGQKHPRAEQQVEDLMQHMRQAITNHFCAAEYQTVAVIGGYGRGEGGADCTGNRVRLQNNVDLLWILPPRSPRDLTALKQRFQKKVAAPLAQKYGIDVDVFFLDHRRLQHLPCLVMLYDMKYGHRTLLGDQHLLHKLPYTVRDILPSDVRNLMCNRAILLLFNQLLLRHHLRHRPHEPLSEDLRKILARHTYKAVLGYGDALLFAHGDYHWSYQEKQKRMGSHLHFPVAVRQHYTRAMEDRFSASPERYSETDAAVWWQQQQELLDFFGPWHLAFENWRMGTQLTSWAGYPEAQFSHAWRAENNYRGVKLRKFKHWLRHRQPGNYLQGKARRGLQVSDSASVFATLFPLVAYGTGHHPFFEEQLPGGQQDVLQHYLQSWSAYLNPGFWRTCEVFLK